MKSSETDLDPEQDPFLEEMRGLKRGLWERFGNDFERVIQHLRELEREVGDRVVSLKEPESRSRR